MSSKASSHSAGPSVAFDLGANAVRVVEIEWSGSDGSGRLVKRGSAPLPVNVWNDLPANAAAFTAALRQALSSAGISAKSVSASLPRRLVTLRFARLPHAPAEAMQGLVLLEAQQYVLFPIEEVVLDHHVFSDSNTGIAIPSEDDMESVLLAAARRSLVLDLISIFEKAGLELDQLTVSALALAEHIRDAIEATAVIDVEPGEMDVAVVANRQLLFTRASGLDVTGAQPEIAARRLADEVARSFTSFQNEYRQQTLTHINLSGPSVLGADGMAVEQTLGSVLEMHIGRLSSRLIPSADPDAVAYATAIGAALQTRPGNLASINLVPDERAIKRALAAQRQRQQIAVVAGIAAIVVGGFFAQHVYAAGKADRAAREEANSKLKTFTESLDAKRKVFTTRKALFDELNTGLDRSHPSIDVLVALNRALPPTPGIWLTQFAFDRSGLITLHGETKSASDATDMVIALQDSGAFTDVKVAYLGDAQENNIVSNAPPVKTVTVPVAVTPTPVTPLPNMQPNNPGGPMGSRFGGPGGGPQNGMPRTGNDYRGGYTGMPQGGNFPPSTIYQPGQAFPGGPVPNGNAPTGQFPPGQIPGAQPSNGQAPLNGQAPTNPGVIFRSVDPNTGGQTIIVPAPVTPPPFFLIGYGQDQTAAQDPNGAQDPNAGQDPNGTDPNAAGGRRRRNRNRQQYNQGNAQGNFQGNYQGNGRRNNFPNSGVTPNGSGSSNMMQNGPMPQGAPGNPNMSQGGPVINPAVSQAAPAAAVVKTVVVPTRKPAVTTKPKTTLTSFIITCRLNPQARTLLTSRGLAPARGERRASSTTAPATRRPIIEDSNSSDSSDNGGTDGSP